MNSDNRFINEIFRIVHGALRLDLQSGECQNLTMQSLLRDGSK